MLVTAREAAEILDVKVHSVYMMATRGRLTRHAPTHTRRLYELDELEAASLERINYTHTGHPYWVTVPEAAEVLGVVPSRVRVLMNREKIPFVTARDGANPLFEPASRTRRGGRMTQTAREALERLEREEGGADRG